MYSENKGFGQLFLGYLHTMHRYRLIIAYDGTDFAGWQRQPAGGSVEQELEAAFGRAFAADMQITAASRTDAGVHARGQVALCQTELQLDPERLRQAWNDALPTSILICSCDVASDCFHPRRNVQSKTYHYRFFTEQPLPFMARYGWYCKRTIDLEKLRVALNGFVGEHDFRAFCKAKDVQGSTVRSIHAITLEYVECFGWYQIAVTGPGFMRHMVRRLVGAAIFVASRPAVSVDHAQRVLLSGDPNNTLGRAPAHGLLLYTIRYKGDL